MCISDDTIEKSVTSPARTHAVRGKRVFTGTLPVILIMAIFPQDAPSVLNQRRAESLRSREQAELSSLLPLLAPSGRIRHTAITSASDPERTSRSCLSLLVA